MICFSLNCSQDHEFEGWFRDSTAFEEQVAHDQLSCPFCNDTKIRKALMAPAVARGREVAVVDEKKAQLAMMAHMMRKVREHVEQNFDNVGPRFAEEARRIHYGETEARDIFGQASLTEAKELVEEGIAVRPLPDVPKLDG